MYPQQRSYMYFIDAEFFLSTPESSKQKKGSASKVASPNFQAKI